MLSANFNVKRVGVCAVALALVVAFVPRVWAAEVVLYDSEGFESPRFAPGDLEGQDGPLTPWILSPSPSPSTGVVQGTIVESGLQAVQIDRASDGDARWFVDLRTVPHKSVVIVRWDMRVDPNDSDEFGPLMGMETYDDDGMSPIRQIGSLYVDAATGEIVYLEDVDPSSSSDVQQVGVAGTAGVYNDGAWHAYQLTMDFVSHTYSIFADSVLLATVGFIDDDLGIDRFSDADITAVAAANPEFELGTAYFDNYVVSTVPLPAPALMALALLGGCSLRRRRIS